MAGSGNYLVDRMDREDAVKAAANVCLDCGCARCKCDDDYERSRDDD